MIAQLTGKIAHKELGFVVINVAGVGYKVYMPITSTPAGAVGEELRVWTHLAVREDALDLYGFSNQEELHFFEQLIRISGIGPKSALGILSTAPIETLKSAISQGNITYLTRISGIGKKTGEKIILELRDKVVTASEASNLGHDGDVLEALVSLGYGQREASEALRHVPVETTGTNERLREALKSMNKK